uniref:Uncharacterized protein n=1 Tax=Oryza glumipatula TaxID=40148 RepID=A0A0D9ZHW1_9ORYZ
MQIVLHISSFVKEHLPVMMPLLGEKRTLDYPTHDKATQAALILLTQDIPYCGDPPCNEATGPVLVAKPFSFGV